MELLDNPNKMNTPFHSASKKGVALLLKENNIELEGNRTPGNNVGIFLIN